MRVNSRRIFKPSVEIKVDDVLTFTSGKSVRVVKVLSLGERRVIMKRHERCMKILKIRLIEALVIKIFTIEFKDIKSVCLNLTSMSD